MQTIALFIDFVETKHNSMNNSLILTQLTIPEVRDIIRQELHGFFETKKETKTDPGVKWFNLTELCEYLPDKPAKQTMYGKISRNEFPHYKDGKKLRFLKSEVDEYLMRGKRFNKSDIDSHVDNLIAHQ